MNVQTIELDLAKRTGRQRQVTIAQGDAAGTTIVATIYDNGTKLAETGVTAKFLIGLPDNRHYMRDDATYEDGVITYVCDESRIASVHGYTDNAYFELHKGDTVASTERFSVIIEQCAYDGMDEGETYDTEIEQALRAMATAIGAVSDAVEMAEGAVSDATTAVTEAQQAVTTANTVTQQAQAAVADAEAATTAANEAAETATEAAETITEANLPHVSVGAANGITGGSGDTAAWLQRVSTADGPTTVKSIHGRTLRWNQLAPSIEGDTWYAGSNTTITRDGDKITATIVADGSGYRNSVIATQGVTGIKLHKYLVSYYVLCAKSATFCVDLFNSGTTTLVSNTAGVRSHIAAIMTFPNNDAITPNRNIYLFPLAAMVAGDTFTVDTPQVYDLTAMFGAGSEPSTIEEFTALYPADYYPYDAGSLMPVNMTGIATEDADGNPLQTRTIPAGTLRSAGSVYDEQTATERIERVRVVDLGTLTWTKGNALNDGTGTVFYAGLTTKAHSNEPDCECAELNPVKFTSPYENATKGVVFITGTAVVVGGDSSLSASDFKASMSGVILYAQWATPTTTTINPALNMTYRTEQGGTERVMVPTGEQSAPPTIVAAQGYTAESLRDAALSAIAPVENGKASTGYAIGTYLIHGGSLCKVTRAIAAGESIEIGTNVTTTTVMAELLALIQ